MLDSRTAVPTHRNTYVGETSHTPHGGASRRALPRALANAAAAGRSSTPMSSSTALALEAAAGFFNLARGVRNFRIWAEAHGNNLTLRSKTCRRGNKRFHCTSKFRFLRDFGM